MRRPGSTEYAANSAIPPEAATFLEKATTNKAMKMKVYRVIGAMCAVLGLWTAGMAAQAGVLVDSSYGVSAQAIGGTNPGLGVANGVFGDGPLFVERTESSRSSTQTVAAAYADDFGTVSVFVKSAEELDECANCGMYRATSQWVGTFEKTDPNDIFQFIITPGTLNLEDNGGADGDDTNPMRASWDLIISISETAGSLPATEAFFSGVEIAGRRGNYTLVREEGTRLNGAFFDPAAGIFGDDALYSSAQHMGTVALGSIGVGQQFDIFYDLIVESEGDGGETSALAAIGDPFDLGGSGLSGRVVSSVPEPASLAVLVIGLVGLATMRRRKKAA